MKNHTFKSLPQVRKIVSPQFCKKLAIQTGFVKRCTSKLDGFEFVNTMIIGSDTDSLLTYSKRITTFNPNSKMSSPALAQRINNCYAENLMLNIYIKCLTSCYEKGVSFLKNINRILIQDSTCLPLNKKNANIFAGSNGHHQTAGVKIDCIYDYTNQSVLNVKSYPRVVPDAKNADVVLDYLEPKDLVLRDLGYFNIEEFEKIHDKAAYFVSRLKVGVNVFLKKDDKIPIDFMSFLKKKLKRKAYLDCELFIGRRKTFVRIIINKLPDDIINEKLRKAKREAQVSRMTLSKEKIAFLKYTILVTNLPEESASCIEILTLYKIRWRIELLFKEWKSQLKIDGILGTNIHRVRCLIYGRFCLLLIMNKFTSYLNLRCLEEFSREVCIKKALDILMKDGGLLQLFLGKNSVVEKLLESSLSLLLKDKHKKRKTTYELLLNTKMAA